VGTTDLAFKDITGEFAKLASPAFTGNPTGPTAALFDDDTSLATTAFVQRALGNNAGVEIVAANRTMTAADAGKYLFTNANNVVYTLPNPATLKLGTKFRITQGNLTSGGSINAPGSVTIGNITDGGTVSSVSMAQSTEYVLTVVSATAYQITRVASGGIPSGSVIHVAMNTAPSGYLKANGAAVSRTTYAALFAAIGTTFGAGDGSTTFALPDLRGEFIRGWDDGRGVDSGRAIGTAQTDAMQGHRHDFRGGTGTSGDNDITTVGITDAITYRTATNSANSGVQNPITDGTNGTPRTASETRPRNVALLACIKF
jgi:microcystin-dependent protein